LELSVHHDKIINTFNSIISNERDRASDASEDRATIGQMIELCGLNKKATSWAKALHKMEPDKRDDVLRSFDALRGELEKNWGGQRTPDMFAGAIEPATALPKPTYDPTFDLADNEEMLADDGEPSWQEERQVQNEAEAELEAEADEFDTHLARAAE
jgi:hypothetical protein